MTTAPNPDDLIYHWDTFDTYEPFEEYQKRMRKEYPELVEENPEYYLGKKGWVDDQTDASRINFNEMLDSVQTALDTFPGSFWHCTYKNRRWTRDHGFTVFKATKALDFLHAFIPTPSLDDSTFTITWYPSEEDAQGLQVINSHHDAMGEEYIIRPATDEEMEDYG